MFSAGLLGAYLTRYRVLYIIFFHPEGSFSLLAAASLGLCNVLDDTARETGYSIRLISRKNLMKCSRAIISSAVGKLDLSRAHVDTNLHCEGERCLIKVFGFLSATACHICNSSGRSSRGKIPKCVSSKPCTSITILDITSKILSILWKEKIHVISCYT